MHRGFACQQPIAERHVIPHAEHGIAVTCLLLQLQRPAGIAIRAAPLMHLAARASRLGQHERTFKAIGQALDFVKVSAGRGPPGRRR